MTNNRTGINSKNLKCLPGQEGLIAMYHYAGSMETCSFHHHQKLDTWEISSEWWMLHQVVFHHPRERNLCKQPSNLELIQPAKLR